MPAAAYITIRPFDNATHPNAVLCTCVRCHGVFPFCDAFESRNLLPHTGASGYKTTYTCRALLDDQRFQMPSRSPRIHPPRITTASARRHLAPSPRIHSHADTNDPVHRGASAPTRSHMRRVSWHTHVLPTALYRLARRGLPAGLPAV